MQTFDRLEAFPSSLRGATVVLGNLDGLHPGHRALIDLAKAEAGARGACAGVLTFEPHPRRLFAPDAPPFRLSTLAAKLGLLAEAGAAFTYVLPFDQAVVATSAEAFVRAVLVAGLGAGHVVVGEDYRFGSKRLGTVQTLRHMGADLGFGVSALAPVRDEDGVPYASSRVRQALWDGNVAAATKALGRPWAIEGVVEHGDARGRTIGFPTANLRLGELLHPREGVYAVTVTGVPGQAGPVPGVANFGRRPTVDGKSVWLEVHLFDLTVDLYGVPLQVFLHDFLRGEKAFNGLDVLKAQIAQDVEVAKRRLSA